MTCPFNLFLQLAEYFHILVKEKIPLTRDFSAYLILEVCGLDVLATGYSVELLTLEDHNRTVSVLCAALLLHALKRLYLLALLDIDVGILLKSPLLADSNVASLDVLAVAELVVNLALDDPNANRLGVQALLVTLSLSLLALS